MTWEEFLTTKFGPCICTHSNTNNTLLGSGRVMEKIDILIQIEKVAESSNDNLTCLVLKMQWPIQQSATWHDFNH